MKEENTHHIYINVFRWVARILSLIIFAFVLFRILTPDPSITEPVPTEDWFLLALWGIAILGLLIAWIWEYAGAVITIATMFIREIAWVILKGDWLVNFLIVWAIIVPPAIFYLMAWRKEKSVQEEMGN